MWFGEFEMSSDIRRLADNDGASDDEGDVCPICFESFNEEEEQDADKSFEKIDEHTEGDCCSPIDGEIIVDNGAAAAIITTIPATRAEPSPPTLRGGMLELPCRHKFCIPCLVTHVGHSVETKRIPLTCPELTCRSVLNPKTFPDNANANNNNNNNSENTENTQTNKDNNNILATLLEHCDEKVVAKVHRLQKMAENPETVPCTACPALVPITATTTIDINNDDSDENDTASPTPDLECPACQHQFCRHHGDMHPNLTCADFQKTPQGQQLRQSEQALSQFTKPCSRCGALLQKANGCDYVVCGHCHGDMCYRCGTHVYFTGGAGTGTSSLRRCTNCKSTYHNELQLPAVCHCVAMCFVVLVYITLLVVWPVMAALAILFSGCCGCFFHCGRTLESSVSSSSASSSHVGENNSSNNNKKSNTRYQPVRGMLVVLVILFFPLAMVVDGLYMEMSENHESFLENLLPGLNPKAAEIPAMELAPTTTTTTTTAQSQEEQVVSTEEEKEEEGQPIVLQLDNGGDDDDIESARSLAES